MAVDGQPFDLVEHRGVGGIQRVGAIDPPGTDDVDGRLLRQHGADLYRRRVGAQHESGIRTGGPGDVEGVLHRPRRMVGPEVERVEVEPLGFQFRTLRHLPAHADEDVLDVLDHGGDGVSVAGRPPVERQRDVDPLRRQHPGVALGDQLRLAGGDGLVDLRSRGADQLPGDRLVRSVQAADGPVRQRERTPVRSNGLQRGLHGRTDLGSVGGVGLGAGGAGR